MYSPHLLAYWPIHPHSSSRRPPGRTDRLILNTNHALSAGLVGAWPVPFSGWGDHFQNKNPVTSFSGITSQGTEFGLVPRNDGGTNASSAASNTDFDGTTGTWNVWFRELTHNGTVRAVLLGRADPGTTPGGAILYINYTDSALKATLTYDISNALNISGGAIVTNQWHMATLRFRGAGGTADICLDGTQVASGTAPASWGFPGFYFGMGYSAGPVLTTTNGLDGNVCLAAWWNRALSDGEVAALYGEPWCMYIPVGEQRTWAGSLTPAALSQGFALGSASDMQVDNDVRQGFALGAASSAFKADDQYGDTSQGIRLGSKFKSDSGELNNGRYRR